MSFTTDEQSREGSSPVELYRFITGPDEYFYTSNDKSVLYASNTYNPVVMERSNITTNAFTQENELEVTLSVTSDLVKNVAFGIGPNRLLLKVYRLHLDTAQSLQIWEGNMSDLSIEGDMATLTFVDYLSRAMNRRVPLPVMQRTCNHVLFDNRCALSSTSHKETTTVAGISADGKTITLTSVGARPDDWANGGYLDISLKEKRLVLDQTGTSIRVSYPFPDISVSDVATLYAGCDHTLDTCTNKFSNEANFGGFPHIPGSNVFRNRLGFKG